MTKEIKAMPTTQEIAARVDELARQGMWFEIQDEFFSDQVTSTDPKDSPYFGYAEGKAPVRQKGMDWVARIREVHDVQTTQPIVGGRHFSMGQKMDLTVEGFGRVTIDQVILYEVKDGQIISEQFFY